MFEAEETVRVDAPRDLVWEWITDLGNFASQIPNATVVDNGEREVTIRDSFHWVNFPPEIGEVDLKISKIEESDKVMRIKGGNRILGTQTTVKVEGREKDGTKVHIQSKWWLRGRAGTAFEWILRTTVLPVRLLKRQQEIQIEGTKSGTEKHLADYWKKQEKKAEARKEFLNTLLRQDLRSKFQTIQGYLQLLDEVDLPDEHREYLRKAVKAGGEADEILELARKLEEIEETEWVAEKHIVKVLDHVIEDISDLAERQGVEIEEDYPEGIGRVKGDYSLSTLFSQILKTRIRTPQCDKIKISTEGKDGRVLVKVEDNGKRLPVDIKNLFKGEPYTGETTGAGGIRYYMLREIAKHNNAEIEVQDSELGGGKFNIYLQKV